MNKSGIYQIRNIINNKVYIGSSKNVYRRWISHQKRLKNNTHFNKFLQQDYNIHGINNFILELIEENNDLEKLYIKEQEFILRKDSYNINKPVSFKNEYREKISIKLKGRSISEEHSFNKSKAQLGKLNPQAKKIHQYSLDGKYIQSFDTIKEATYKLNIHKNHIIKCCKMKIRYTHGFVFRYALDFPSTDILIIKKKIKKPNLSKYKKGKKLSYETRLKLSKKVNQYNLNGIYIKTWDSIKEIKEKLNLNVSKKAKTHQVLDNCLWRFVDDDFEIGKNLT